MNFDSDDDGSNMSVPPSPEQGAAAGGAPESPTAMDLNMPSTPLRSRSGRGNAGNDFDDSDDDDDDQQAMPATPPPLLASAATPSTPLTPLSGLEDNDDDDDDDAAAQPAAPQQQQQQHEDDNVMMDQQEDATTLARGTDVNVHEAATTFTNFLRTFRKLPVERDDDDDESDASDEEEEDESPPLYIAKLQQLLHHTKPCSLDIDTMHLFFHNPACQRFYHQLVNYPMELVPLMDLVLQREMRALVQDDDNDIPVPSIQVRPYNLQELSNLRCLDPISMDSLVCLKGMIVRCSPIIPDLKVAHFSCVICGHDHQVTIDRGRIQEPHQCASCNTKDTYQLVHNRSIFADKQLVRLQETPDQVPAGQTPASVVTFCFDDLVDQCQPGDKVEVTGVLRAQPVRVNPKISKLKSIYKTYVDVIHFRTVTGMERHQQQNGQKITQQRIQQLHELSKQPDIYEQLTQSLAPSIWELDNVKKGVLTMLFGGNHQRVQNKDDAAAKNDDEEWSEDEDDNAQTNDASGGAGQDTKLHKRGDINILLCGDPGTSKSQLLSYVHKLSARGVYTSGKGSSAVGLTASVIRDPETRDLVLESGALVLSDRGICCIDEFDKMTDAVRTTRYCMERNDII